MELPGHDILADGISSSLQTLGLSKKYSDKLGALIYLVVALFFSGSIIAASLVVAPDILKPKTLSPVSTSTPIAAIGSNVAVGNTAPVDQSINNFPKPKLDYSVHSAPTQQNDGLWSTTYKIDVSYVPGTWDSPQFWRSTSIFSSCDQPQGFGTQFAPVYIDTVLVKCLSKEPPGTDKVLFWIVE